MTISPVLTADLPDAFFIGWANACRARGWHPLFGFGVMKSESDLRASAINAASGATGLIQWDPPENSGHDQASLLALGPVGQLPLVVAWWDAAERRKGSTLSSVGDFYQAVFLPGTMGKPDPIAASGGPFAGDYEGNLLLDPPPRTGAITHATLARRVAIAEATENPARWQEAVARLGQFADVSSGSGGLIALGVGTVAAAAGLGVFLAMR